MDEKAAMGLADLGSRHDPGGSPPIQLIDEAFAAAQRVAEAFHERADADVEARGIHQHEIAVDDELAAAVQFDGVDFLNRNRCLDGKDALPAHLWLNRSEEHTSELQSLMRIQYAVFCLKKKKNNSKTET